MSWWKSGKPTGGQWNYDQKNRQAYDSRVAIPEPLFFDNDVSEIVRTIRKKKVINDDFEGKKIVIFYAGKTVSVLDEEDIEDSQHVGTVTVFSSIVDGKQLLFRQKKGKYVDAETGSIWDITGRCLDGYYKDKQLVTEVHSNHFAFAWLAFHPKSEIYE